MLLLLLAKKMNTRKKLEKVGFIFRRGVFSRDTGRFRCSDAPIDNMPPMLDDLEGMGYVRVKKGIMEPPRGTIAGGLMGLGILAAIGIGIYLFTKEE